MNEYVKTGDAVVARYFDLKKGEHVEVEGEFLGFGINDKNGEPFLAVNSNGVERKIGLDFFDGIEAIKPQEQETLQITRVERIGMPVRADQRQTEVVEAGAMPPEAA